MIRNIKRYLSSFNTNYYSFIFKKDIEQSLYHLNVLQHYNCCCCYYNTQNDHYPQLFNDELSSSSKLNIPCIIFLNIKM